MRIRLGWVSDIIRELLREGSESAGASRPSARPRLEALEDRLVLSASLPAGPLLHGVNLAVPGDAYALAGTSDPTDYTAMTKWSQPGGLGTPVTITYSYSNLLDGAVGLSAATVKATIQEALSRWAAVAPLRFVEVPDSGPPISTTDYTKGSTPMIRFGHLTLDGPGGTLGYGYYPGGAGLSGDVVFDDSEHWTTNPATGIDLLEVAEHEIGHALGLAHEPPPSAGGLQAIMNPYYAGVFHGLGTGFLFSDDINGVRALYGSGVGSVTPYDPTPVTPASVPQTSDGFTLIGTTLYITVPSGSNSQAGQLQVISPAGTILSMSAVTERSGVRDVFAITTGAGAPQFQNTLWEYSTATGWSQLSSGSFRQISAATNSAGRGVVFGVLNDGSLFEQDPALGTGLNAGFLLLSPAGTIQAVSAVTDAAGHPTAYAIVTTGSNLWQYSAALPGSGWAQLSTGSFQQISAGLNAAGQATMTGTVSDGSQWKQDPANGFGLNVGFTRLATGGGALTAFVSVPAGFNAVTVGSAADSVGPARGTVAGLAPPAWGGPLSFPPDGSANSAAVPAGTGRDPAPGTGGDGASGTNPASATTAYPAGRAPLADFAGTAAPSSVNRRGWAGTALDPDEAGE